MNMDIGTLQRVFDKLISSGGKPIIHGERAYQIYRNNDHAWIHWLPVDEYRKNWVEYDKSPVGWFAFLRIA